MAEFVKIKGTVFRTAHVSAVTEIHRGAFASTSDTPDHFIVVMLGSGANNGIAVWGKGRQLTAERNKLLRAMGAVL